MNSSTFPFESCPVEIIQAIFENAVLTAQSQLKHALIISHICRPWREIALATPRLWAEITLNINRPFPILDEYWDEMLRRVQGVPLEIAVTPGESTLRDSLPTNFQQAVSIDTLLIYFGSYRDDKVRDKYLQELINLTFPLPLCPIRHLKLSFLHLSSRGGSFDLYEWLCKWPPIQNITIFGRAVSHGIHDPPLLSLKSLCLYSPGGVNFFNTIASFSSLETLQLFGISQPDKQPPSSQTVIPSLKYLAIDGTIESIWDRISCPNLVAVVAPQDNYTPSFYRFLGAHQRIQRLKLTWQDKDVLKQLATIAPQISVLETAVIDGFEVFYDSESRESLSPLFPNLDEIIISDLWSDITLKKFESLVSARYLPRDHPQCQRGPGLKHQAQLLKIITDKRASPPWLSSRLIDSVRNVKLIREGRNAEYELRWRE